MDIKTADGASARGVLGQRGYRGVYCRPAALLARATAGDRPSGGRTRLGRNNGPPARERTARAEPRVTGGGGSGPARGGVGAWRRGGGGGWGGGRDGRGARGGRGGAGGCSRWPPCPPGGPRCPGPGPRGPPRG